MNKGPKHFLLFYFPLIMSLFLLMIYLLFYNDYERTSIDELNIKLTGKKVMVCGYVDRINVKDKFLSFYLIANGSSVRVVSFDIMDIAEGDFMCVKGTVKLYKNKIYVLKR